MKEKLKKLKQALSKPLKKIKISVTINISRGWWYRTCGFVIFGSAWQCVAGGNSAWYYWVLFVAGSWLGMYNLDKGYAKLYQEEDGNEQDYSRTY
ncbi:uncharacterized protein KNN_04040 [Bacillus thuringiensis serovar tolworthi]|uniref:Uncharacterized protein n=1 Tax=Bacillus thuringiensis subsp. tolworthi TaxID=1442 RepID=A0A9W4EVD1_BACTO|nr:hypothetical protein [Bacillus thuringiensis]MEB8855708.1 hypothetical protein [Bacillus cereus]BAR84884.1 uncharacterized protein KNN_04040 [Bacillus thuringiensis serovar tolworthi]MDR5047607.1 hypothetical protein [Bacillus thuringiensis]MEB9433009.1 hypothetical protein [Bacillus cereus]MEB9481466.1 hypothetical protein [Bacillus cereus]